MGIADRDYYRERPGGGPGGWSPGRGGPGGAGPLGTLSMLSANTWIIVLCVAVFVIDLMLPVVLPLDMGVRWLSREAAEAFNFDPSGLVAGEVQQVVHPQTRQPVEGWVPLYAPTQTGRPVEVARNMVVYMPPLQWALHFSTQRGFLELQLWRLIGFQFLHANGMHLLFNMIGLFFFGPIVEQYLGRKRYVAFYLLCGICGALMYLVLNIAGVAAVSWLGPDVRIPGLLFNSVYTPLIGASAGVFGVLMAGAYLAPNAMVLLFFFLPMRLRTLAYALVALALFTLVTGGANAGGEAGHLGGAIAGFFLIRRPHHLHGFFDVLGRVDPTSHHYRGGRGVRVRGSPSDTDQRELDRVLAKISERGIQSLTPREKRLLSRASRRTD